MSEVLPWVEKYRPVNLDDIIGNKPIIQNFKNIVEKGNVPHMLLVGRPGLGKTTGVTCLARAILGDKLSEAFLELNASDKRGIDIVRGNIVNFCQKKVTFEQGVEKQKIIFLDEFESMTLPAQQALRRIIEVHSKTTRFVLACNDASTVTDAIQSRCLVLQFSKVNQKEISGLLCRIADAEGLKYDKNAIKEISMAADGDVRSAINYLQRVYNTYKVVNLDNVTTIIDKPNHVTMSQLLKVVIEKKFENAKPIVDELINKGYYGLDVVRSLFKVIREYDMNDQLRLKYMSMMGNTEINLIQGGDEYLQILSLISKMILDA
jgi:replication factor C subunit 2/4